MDSITSIQAFQSIDADPGGEFNDYIRQMKLLFSLVFRKSDGTAYAPTDREMKAMTLLKGGKHMHTMFEHVGDVREADTFQEAVEKI